MRTTVNTCTIIVLLFLCLPTALSAQIIAGSGAAKDYPGTNLLRYDPTLVRPTFLRFDENTAPAQRATESYFARSLRSNPDESLTLLRSEQDQIGYTHDRYEQRFHGHRVVGGTLISHSRKGLIVSLSGKLYDRFNGSPDPVISSDEAFMAALLERPSERYAWQIQTGPNGETYTEKPSPKLVWVPADLDFKQDFQLAYEVTVQSMEPLFRERLYLSADDGKVIARVNLLHETDEPGTAHTRYSGTRAIVADRSGSNSYRLRESGRNITTLNLQEGREPGLAVDFTDTDNDWNNVNSAMDEVATDAHWAAEVYHDLLDSMGRNSIDNQGGTLISYVHFGGGVANAFWDGTASLFGDGSPGSRLDRPLTTSDIVGHEFTHGLVDYTAELIYDAESGALNESFADIFGFVTTYVGKGAEQTPWLIGSQATPTGEGIRSFTNPNIFDHPDTYQGDFWRASNDVHINSSIQNHWFYLLAAGGQGSNDLLQTYVVDGVGVDTAFAIAFRNLTVYLTESSTYEDAAFFALVSASDLYSSCSSVYRSTNNAWAAVGLGQNIPENTEASFAALRNHCSVPASVQFNNLSGLITEAFWDFGDGSTSDDISPSHTYTAAGSYDVSLTVVDCNGERDSITIADYITLDPDRPSCDTLIMVSQGSETITRCEGVIVDPGGANGDYGNRENSIFTINAPDGGDISLTFPEFNTEFSFDFLSIFDGGDIDATLIGRYDGNELQGQTITTTSGSATLQFTTDGSVTRSGFICSFVAGSGDVPAVADFSLSSTSLLFNEPLVVNRTVQTVGAVSAYDMGDGTVVNQIAGYTHRYQQPGTFIVTQFVSTCSFQDTISQTVTVAEPGNATISPDSICITLTEGEVYLDTLRIANAGPGVLHYDMQILLDTTVRSSTFSYEPDQSTFHELDYPDSEGPFYLRITLNGNFDSPFEFAELFVEDEFIGNIGEGNNSRSNGEDIVFEYFPSGAESERWARDESIEVTVANSFDVRFGTGGNQTHTVELVSVGEEFVYTEAALTGAVPVGGESSVPLTLDSEGLYSGTYRSTLLLQTGDIDAPTVRIPVKMEVIGRPELTARPGSVDFGEQFTGIPASQQVVLENMGTGDTRITDLRFTGGDGYRVSIVSGELRPEGTDTLTITFDASSPGVFSDTLFVVGNVPTLAIPLTAIAIPVPGIAIDPDSLCFIIEDGETQTQALTISSVAEGPLRWQIPVGAQQRQKVLIWTADLDVNSRNFLFGLFEELETPINLSELTTAGPEELAAALENTDILVIPAVNDRNQHANAKDVVQAFMNRGGSLLALGRSAPALEAYELGFLGENFFFADELTTEQPRHAMMEGVTLPYDPTGVFTTINAINATGFQPVITFRENHYLSYRPYGQGQIVYLGAFFEAGANGNDYTILGNAIQYLKPLIPDYVSLDNTDDTTEPGATSSVNVSVNGQGVPAGTYRYDMEVNSNVPNQPTTIVPLKVIIRTAPTAAIGLGRDVSCDGLFIFTDESAASPTRWSWNFGDGNTSEEQSPQHTYTTSGTYTVTLEACNDIGCTTDTRTVSVTLGEEFCTEVIMESGSEVTEFSCTGVIYDDGGPDSDYSNRVESTLIIAPPGAQSLEITVESFNLESCCDRVTIYAGPISNNEVVGRYGRLEVGTVIAVDNPMAVVVFSTDGSVTSSGFELRWRCIGSAPVPAFTASPATDCANRMVFTNTSFMADSYLWDFGDGTTSTATNPTHDYSGLGAFDVTLTAINDFSEVEAQQTVAIGSVPFALTLDFPDTIAVNEEIAFRANSNATLTAHTWTLGLGNPLNLAAPRFVYRTPGVYSITLNALDQSGCGVTVTRPLVVTQTTSVRLPDADLAYRLYPNPATSAARLEVDLPGSPTASQLTVSNGLGQVIHERQLAPVSRVATDINTSGWPAGVYTVRLWRSNQSLLTARLVVR